MRWSTLFDDLEARLEADEKAERRAEVADRTRREQARVVLGDRLAVTVGRSVSLRLGDRVLAGRLADLGQDWVLLHLAGGQSAIVPLARVEVVEGAQPWSDARPGVSRRRFGLGVALRELSRDRAVVRVLLASGGELDGLVSRVGADHLDLVREDPVRGGRPSRDGGLMVPFGGVVAVLGRA